MNTNDLFRPIGGVFTSPPDIVAWGPGQTNLFPFAVGTDQALWYSELHGFFGDTNPWSEWQSLGGVVLSRPRAVSKGESVVDVFAAGAGSELLRWRFVNGAWTSSESLGGNIVSPPDAVLFGDLPPSLDTIPVFALGTDHALWAWNGSWATLGHRLRSPPHAVRWQGDFAVFALGIDSAVWYTMGGDWHSLGGRFRSAPYAVSTSTRIHVFAADTQSELQHRSWDGNSWTGWESLGGSSCLPPQPAASRPMSRLKSVFSEPTLRYGAAG